jgi:hypothetical protein
VAEPAEKVINDWLADELWQMRWLELADSFDVARAELATRLAVVRVTLRKLRRLGVREDQAAAEAVMIGEMAAACEHWADVVDAIANDPSPASVLAA